MLVDDVLMTHAGSVGLLIGVLSMILLMLAMLSVGVSE